MTYHMFSRLSKSNLNRALRISTVHTAAHSAPFPRRTHDCGSLTAGNAGNKVVLAGWLLPERKGKAVSFYPLRDSSGTTQLIVNHSSNPSASEALSSISVESAVLIEGTVSLRPENARRPGAAGEIDVEVDQVTLLNPAANLPFVPSNVHNLPSEEVRARYRFLDLRRTALAANIKKRSTVAHIVRSTLHGQGFTEVETPILLRSSPEGAREFLVPTRLSNASDGAAREADPLFYALQQSPQQPKQLLICSGGVDKYFQIAKCFRDEDGRKDRQPEFTQVDLEMAFVSWGSPNPAPTASNTSGHDQTWNIGGHEVREVIEGIIRKIWLDVEGVELPPRFKVMTYREAMERMMKYGSDKPDTRFGLEILNASDLLSGTPPSPASTNEEILECIVVRKSYEPELIAASRTLESSETEHWALTKGSIHNWLLKSHTARSLYSDLAEDAQTILNDKLQLEAGDHVFLSRRKRLPTGGSTALGRTRLAIFEAAQNRGDVIVTEKPHLLWITEFPLFTHDDSDKDFLAHGRWSSSHHPFTAPMWQDIDALYKGDIEHVRGQHYDLVLNGVEIGGGSVRIHDASMQDFIFTQVLQLSEQEKEPFNHLLQALRCGAPPHGGIALGFDRLMAMLCKTQSIRDVIAFP